MSALLLLRAVPATGLLAVADPLGVQRPTDDLVTHARQVAHAAAPYQHDRVLLQVVPDAGDVRGHLDLTGELDPGHLAQRGVRLLRGGRVHARAHAPPLRAPLQRRRLRLRRLRLAALADQLLDRGHPGLASPRRSCSGVPTPALGRVAPRPAAWAFTGTDADRAARHQRARTHDYRPGTPWARDASLHTRRAQVKIGVPAGGRGAPAAQPYCATTVPATPQRVRNSATAPQTRPATATPRPVGRVCPGAADGRVCRIPTTPRSPPPTASQPARMANAPSTHNPHPASAPARPRHAASSETTSAAIPATREPTAAPEVAVGGARIANPYGEPGTGSTRAGRCHASGGGGGGGHTGGAAGPPDGGTGGGVTGPPSASGADGGPGDGATGPVSGVDGAPGGGVAGRNSGPGADGDPSGGTAGPGPGGDGGTGGGETGPGPGGVEG